MNAITPIPRVSLRDKYDVGCRRVLLNGNQAVVRLMLMQRAADAAEGLATAGFASGYRGSPLAGLDMAFQAARHELDAADIRFHPGLNEDLAATSVWGTQQLAIVPGATRAGVFGLWYGKGPGVDRSGDALKHANAAGTHPLGGVIALAGDDHVAQSSSLAHQSEFALADAFIPVFVPATLAEIIDWGLYAYQLSRFSGLWTSMKVTASVIETTAVIDLPHPRAWVQPDFPFPPGGPHLRWPDDPVAQEERLHRVKLPATDAFLAANPLDQTSASPDDVLGVLTIGKSSLDVAAALETLGVRRGDGVRVHRAALAWPPRLEALRAFAQGLKQIVVVEEKRPLIEAQLREALYGVADPPVIVGKRDETGSELFRPTLDLDLATVTRVLGERVAAATGSTAVRARLAAMPRPRPAPRLATRTPFFCSGCPHNSSTRVPEGSLALGGIGCHSMAMNMDRGMTAYTHMGGEGANWIGLAPFTATPHIFQNLGDGTYFHSGALAIRAAIAAGVTITYKILFNDAVAMTGGQPVDGALTVPALIDQLRAEGVGTIVVAAEDPGRHAAVNRHGGAVEIVDRRQFDAVSQRLREVPGVSVLIYDQTCAAEKRRLIKRGKRAPDSLRVFINERVCEGCGDCVVASNCLSVVPVDTELGEKRRIDQRSCNTDLSCLAGFCPSLVTVVGGVPRARAARARATPPQVPDAVPASLDRPQRILICGVGGTGVVTIGAVLAMAAHLEGKGATVLDATGMAQKGGSVWSHLTIAPATASASVAATPDGAADVLIGCDLLVAANPLTIAKLSNRTRAAVSVAAPPTGEQVLSPGRAPPIAGLRLQLEASGAEVSWCDATELAEAWVGDTLGANMFLTGVALQRGWLPLSLASITAAIELNGRDVPMNLAALHAGGAHACGREPPTVTDEGDRDKLNRALALAGRGEVVPLFPSATAVRDGAGGSFADRREEDLVAWGGRNVARRYRRLVDAAAAAAPDAALSDIVAQAWFKLLAIKDEWEVARLYTDGAFRDALDAQFGERRGLRFHMSPWTTPDATGRPAKRSFGGWLYPLLWVMARCRRLRGTMLDPFARTAERRRERALADWYEATMAALIPTLSPRNADIVAEIAALPLSIRGFGPIKMRAADAAMARYASLQARLHEAPAQAAA